MRPVRRARQDQLDGVDHDPNVRSDGVAHGLSRRASISGEVFPDPIFTALNPLATCCFAERRARPGRD
jgi:hypothetical protein